MPRSDARKASQAAYLATSHGRAAKQQTARRRHQKRRVLAMMAADGVAIITVRNQADRVWLRAHEELAEFTIEELGGKMIFRRKGKETKCP